MPSTARTPPPERPPPPVPPPPVLPPPPDPSPSLPGEEYHTPTPSFEASPREASSPEEDGSANDGEAIAKSPQLSPMRFPSPNRLPPPSSPTANNGQERRAATASPVGHARTQLRLATGLVRTPSQGSAAAKSPSPSPSPSSPLTPAPAAKSPSPSPPSPLTPTPAAKSPSLSPPSPLTPAQAAKSPSLLTLAAGPAINSGKSGQSTPKRAEARKPPPSPSPVAPPAAQFNPAEEAVTSPLRVGEPRLDQQRRTPAAAENGGAAGTVVPPDEAAVAKVGERRATLSVALRLASAVLSLAAFSVMVSARTSGWAGDYYGRHEQYRYAIGVNVIVCAYSIAQCFSEIRRLISPRLFFGSMSSYFSLFLDQVLAYLLMSASSAAASHNDLWVSRFGTDPFNKKINSAVWLSFIAFLTLAANALISTANLFSMV